MISISSDELQRIHWAIFSLQRLKGMAHVLSVWMAHGTMSAWEGGAVSLPDCEKVGQAYFDAHPGQAAALPAYCAALQAARQLDHAMAEFLAQGAQGDVRALLERSGAALTMFAGVVDQLPGYPGAADDAPALRSAARHCLALLAPQYGPAATPGRRVFSPSRPGSGTIWLGACTAPRPINLTTHRPV